MTTENNPILQQIDLGFQVEAFLQSDIGRYLIKRAEDQIEENVELLKRVNPDNTCQIRAIQHNIHVAEDFQYWLGEAVQAGLNAQQQLYDQEGA